MAALTIRGIEHSTTLIALQVERARIAAHEKHGANSIEAIVPEDPRWLSILIEEVGEAAHELTYDSGGTLASLRAELIDVITVATAWVAAIDDAGEPL